MNKKTLALCCAAFVLLFSTGCTSGKRTVVLFDPPTLHIQSWVDAPFEGDHLPLAAYEIVTHTNVSTGVAAVELSINDAVVLTTKPDAAPTLAVVRYTWTPTAEGLYLIAVRGQDAEGTWGDKSDVQFLVEKTKTVILQPISVPVIPEIIQVQPAIKVGPSFGEQTLSTDAFYYRGTGCGAMSVTVDVQAADPEGVASVALWYRLQDKSSTGLTDWTELPMVRQPSRSSTTSVWSVEMASDAMTSYTSYETAWVELYSASLDGEGTRSQSGTSRTDLTLAACHTSAGIEPVIIPARPIKIFTIPQEIIR